MTVTLSRAAGTACGDSFIHASWFVNIDGNSMSDRGRVKWIWIKFMSQHVVFDNHQQH